ncbi:MAG: potassium channel protein [Bacteroidota bacterium]|nr:potassium channel protein [Bacteroidota bacterium]
MFREFRNLYYGSIVLLIIVFIGILGYMTMEGFTFLEAIYMTIITISTVGFAEVSTLSDEGRLFTIMLIISSFGLFGYIITSITRVFFDGEYKKIIKLYKVNRKLKKLKNHVIVCGFGRNGRKATFDLLEEGKKVVVIERDDSVIKEDINESIIGNPNFISIVGDASHEESLLKTKPETASALVTTLPNDAENLLIVLTIRELYSDIKIISRASDEHSLAKLKRAGASNIIMPDIVGGARMAKLVTQPDIVEFLEMIMLKEGVDVQLEELFCRDLGVREAPATIASLDVRRKTGVNMIGVKTHEGKYIYNPEPDMVLNREDKIFVIGTPKQISKLEEMISGNDLSD